MKKKMDVNEPAGQLKKIRDLLPPPTELVQAEETRKVTIALTQTSIDFFKKQAKKNKTKYQRMIRNLLEIYVEKYSN